MVTLCAPAERERRSGVAPRTEPSIATDEPSGTDWISTMPGAAASLSGAEEAGVAVHVCHTSQAATTPMQRPPTAAGNRRNGPPVRGGTTGSSSEWKIGRASCRERGEDG